MIHRPQSNEYPAFAQAYVDSVPDENVLELLEVGKQVTYDLFRNLSEEQAMHAYAEGKWTLKQVLGHMIDTERTFAYRSLCFSRNNIELPGFDQDIYVNNTDFNGRTIQSLADEYKATRESNMFLYRSFSEEQLLRGGKASGYPVTVRGLVYMTAGHEQYHLKLIKQLYL
ncbi:MAG: DinB family protein [Mucilaginibacter sp.]|nr:DinB family protein [Mucilaginibacter sp.]